MRRVLPPITAEHAKILFAALQIYQENNASLLHGWTITDTNHIQDIELYTGMHCMWDRVEELKQLITATFPENPAN